jgi:hypothetical protein
VGVWVCIQNRKLQNSLRSVGNCFASRSNVLLRCLRIIKLGLNNKLLKGREGGEGGSWKKSSKKCCNYLLGIIYKLLEGSQGDRKEVVRKKDKKKFEKKFIKKFKKRSNKSSTKRFK